MENYIYFVYLAVVGILIVGDAGAVKVGPALVFSNDVSGSGTSQQQPQQLRTTTVYGFLDFTTTIDHTVVVFRPSSASMAAPASADTSSSTTTIAASVVPPQLDGSRRTTIDNNAVTLPTKQAFTASVTLVSDQTPSSSNSPIRKPPIKTGRISLTDDDKTTEANIVPTPTLARTSNDFQPQPGGLPGRRTSGSQSSLAEKRRRFLAHSRRNRPTPPPPSSSTDIPADSSPANPFFRHAHRPGQSPADDLSGLDQSSDQEMAETIEVTPSKVKRFQDLANLSTFFALPASEGGDRKERGGRILVRKLYRRPGSNRASSESGSAKNRLMALRRPSSKNRQTFAGARAEAADDEQHKKEQQHQQRLKEVLMAAAAANQAVTSSQVNNEIVPTAATSKLADPTSATIAEYLHDNDASDFGADSINDPQLRSSILSSFSSTSPGENEADLPPPVSDFPELQGSQLEFDNGHPTSPSPLDENANESGQPTAPLPIIKASRRVIGGGGHGDPGLTVPLQLSIVTSTFSLTETKLQTSLLPVYDGTSTTYYTLTQSFLVTKTVTTFQTVPPKEFMPYLIPGNESYDALNDVLDEFTDPQHQNQNAILQRKSDVNTDTESPLGNDPEQLSDELLEKSGSEHLPVDANGAPKVDPAANQLNPLGPGGFAGMNQQQQQQMNPLLGNLPFLNLLGPAALGLNPYFPYGLGLPQVVTTSRPIYATDVIFTSKLLPIIDGLTTSYHTVRAAASTVTRTTFETFTTQVAGGGNPLQHAGLNHLQGGPQQQQQVQGGVSTVTSPHTFVTTETQTATQVFKLIRDGYKTSYRTVTSQTEVTRTVTTFSTSTVPIYNTQNLLPFFG